MTSSAHSLRRISSMKMAGLHSLLADASVRFLSCRLAPNTWHALLTRSGGESLPPCDF